MRKTNSNSSQLKSKSSALRVTRKSLTALLFKRCCKCYFHSFSKDYSGSSRLYNLKTQSIENR